MNKLMNILSHILKIFNLKAKYKIKNLKHLANIIDVKLPPNIDGTLPFKRLLTQSHYVKPGDWIIDAGWYKSEDIIIESIKKGATVIFCTSEVKEKFPQDFVIAVEKPLEAVNKFEKYLTEGYKAKRICITGSIGKTTTTGLINSVIANTYKTLTHNSATNSHGGILRTVQNMRASHEYWVQEVGGVQPGYIENTAYFLNPDIVVLTNISDSHLNLYKTKENIFKDKSSLERYAKKNATIIINYDDEILKNAKYTHKVVTVSLKDPAADYYAKNIKTTKDGLYFTAVCKNKREIDIHVNLLGEYNAYNALYAIAVGELSNINLDKIPPLLETYHPSGMRQNHMSIGGYSIYVDTFNAEPNSVLSAAQILEKMIISPVGRKIFITGHIDKLGDNSALMHKELGKELAKLNIDKILLFAGDSKYTYEGLKEAGFNNVTLFNAREDLDNWLKNNLKKEDEVFFKSGQFEACLAKDVDNIFGTSLQNELQFNNGYILEENDCKLCIRNDNIAEVIEYIGKEKDLIIPSNYEDNTILRISPFAFKEKNIEQVDIPNSITVIGKEAFFRCFNLKKIKLSEQLLYIDKNAFNSCIHLEEIEIPENVIHIERRAFYDCKSLRKAIIPERVGFIGEDAFKNTSKDFVIVCKKGSYAEKYAKDNGIKVSYIK